MEGGLGRVTHHPDYYFDDGNVSFLTEGILFKVHKTFFQRESEVFRDLFESTANDVPPLDTDAFMLDVTAEDFAQFLWLWYDREYGYHQRTKANWFTILRLATRWRFDKIKELALRETESLELPPADRISTHDDHIDGEQLISSCVELCKSPSVPTQDEARCLPMDTLIKVLQAREDAQRKAAEMGHETPTSACLEDEALREIVSKHFEKGLNPRSSGTSTGSGDQALNLNTARRTLGAASTIIVREPQVPDRKTQIVNQPPSHLTNSDGSQDKEQGEQVEGTDVHKEGNQVMEGEGEKTLAEDKEKEKVEKAKQVKERAGREGAEKDKEKDKENEVEGTEGGTVTAGESSRQNPKQLTGASFAFLTPPEAVDLVYSFITCIVVVAAWRV